jgi:hypothetical protein
MKIVYKVGGEYSDCIVKYFDLNDFEKILDDDTVIFWGWSSLDGISEKEEYKNYKNKYFINTAQPCEIINGVEDIEKQNYFDKVFTICPYTPKVLNNNEKKYSPICFPYNEKYFKKYNDIKLEDKNYDVIYYGQIHHELYINLIDTIIKFNYRLCAPSVGSYTNFNQQNKITNLGISSLEKWDLLSKCKISVGFNLIFINDNHINNLKKLSNIELFNNIDLVYSKKIMPQMKTRTVEAALTKTLMLIYKDEWNVIENWFEPNVDFLYWETFEELEKMIEEILHNYKDYWHIVENAHKKVKNFSLDKLFKKIKNEF